MATNGHSGYPLKWFKDQNAAKHAWECAICLKVLKDPVQVRDCGHQFCALCIDDILKTDPRCPSCRIEISDAMIFEDHAARRLIKQLEVNCCNEGCGWHGHLSALLQEHQSGCNVLIHSGDGAHQLDVRKLEQKLETLMLKVSTLEKKHEEDIKELKSKHENEMAQVKLQHDTLRQEFLMSRTMGAVHAPHVLQQILPRQEPVLSYTWQIPKNLITKKLTKAKCGIVSDPFISSHGYMMKFGINSNEASSGYAGYMGIYLILMKSDQDGVLIWPFNKRFTFVLVDQQDDVGQRKNIKATLVPKGEGAFMKPHKDENEGYGYQNFVQHLTLGTRQYIRNNFACINVLIEP